MKYVSIDIETSGLNHDMNHVLSIGAIIEDTNNKLPYEELPKFNAIVLQKNIQGSPRAITMNKEIISLMGEYLEGTDEVRGVLNNNSGYQFYEEEDVIKEFYTFLWCNGFSAMDSLSTHVNGKLMPIIDSRAKPITLNVAGKNFGTFDKLFLQELPWWQKLIRTRQRVLDPAILCVDWVNDTSLPSLTACKERMNVEGIVTHNALEDAWDVIEILRKFY
jgi:DNA polymerase III epsilon subunit-like protein